MGNANSQLDLPFDDVPRPGGTEVLADGAVVLRGFACDVAGELLDGVERVAAVAPFRHMSTPGGGRMSAAMTNCGPLGWTTDRSGYRYTRDDPETGAPWPPMPERFLTLAAEAAAAAGYVDFVPDACLVNRYEPGAKMGLHRDKDELDFDAPIVSVSLGIPATFQWGGTARSDKPRRVPLAHGDVVVFGGASRLVYHGVLTVPEATHARAGRFRFNLTLRRYRER